MYKECLCKEEGFSAWVRSQHRGPVRQEAWDGACEPEAEKAVIHTVRMQGHYVY